MTVLGPRRRGVIVATEDPARARRDREWLEDAGIPAAVPAELGLARPAPPRGRAFAEMEAVEGLPASEWATALRRPAMLSSGESVLVAEPRRGATPFGRKGASDALGRLLERLPPPRVAVFGGAWVGEDEPEYEMARRFGRGLAEAGVEIVTGGYQGIMAAASRGAAEADAPAIVGITIAPWSERVAVNEWLSHEVEARDLLARLPVICDADAWVAFPGGVGTLSEVALCWNLVQTDSVDPRPLVIVGERWDRALGTFRGLLMAEDAHFDLVRPADSVEEALRLALEALPTR